MNSQLQKSVNRIIVFSSISIFICSLFMPTFYIDRADKAAWSGGLGNLIVGVLSGELSWYANPAILGAWILGYKGNTVYTIFASSVALALMLGFLMVGEVLTSESGARSRVTDFLIGYWFWVSSAVMMVVGFISIWFYEKKRSKS